MSYTTKSKSTKCRRFLEELEIIELADNNEFVANSEINSFLPSTSNQINVSDSNNDSILWNDDYDSISVLSSTDSENSMHNKEKSSNYDKILHEIDDLILGNLAKWAVDHNITQTALSALLKVLKLHKCHNYFPIDARTILKTKLSVKPFQLQIVPPGNYYHFKIYNSLQYIYNSDSQYFVGNDIKIVIGIDGLPLTKSSSSCFWPILGYVRHPYYKPYVFLIGLYWGKEKPFDCNSFLLDLVNEIKQLYQDGFQTKCGKKKVIIETICCDLPAKSFITKTKGHTGYHACSRCTINGVFAERRVFSYC